MTKMSEIEAGILQAVRDMKAGKAAKTHTASSLEARRRGRPPLPMVKVSVKLRLDADLLSTLRLSGPGWQTRINETLRNEFMTPKSLSSATPVFEQILINQPAPDVWLKDAMSTGLVHRPYGRAQLDGVYDA